jgi:hypothetical protein
MSFFTPVRRNIVVIDKSKIETCSFHHSEEQTLRDKTMLNLIARDLANQVNYRWTC